LHVPIAENSDYLKYVTTLPCEILMLKIATKLALMM